MGFEPTTAGATVRSSTTELYPPQALSIASVTSGVTRCSSIEIRTTEEVVALRADQLAVVFCQMRGTIRAYLHGECLRRTSFSGLRISGLCQIFLVKFSTFHEEILIAIPRRWKYLEEGRCSFWPGLGRNWNLGVSACFSEMHNSLDVMQMTLVILFSHRANLSLGTNSRH